MKFTLNYPAIPVLSVCFTRSTSFLGRGIQLFTGGLSDLSHPNHTFPVYEERGQKFACDETVIGLVGSSMEKYTSPRNRIVACYYWTGWDDVERAQRALDRMAYIRRKQGDRSTQLGKYDYLGIIRFIPIVGKFKVFNRETDADWCSENTASIMQSHGASWIKDKNISPIQLLKLMQESEECKAVLNFYKYPDMKK